jgi:hypothetical protein
MQTRRIGRHSIASWCVGAGLGVTATAVCAVGSLPDLQATRERVVAAKQSLTQAQANETEACAAADRLDDDLLRVTGDPKREHRAVAQEAQAARRACSEARQLYKRQEAALAEARADLRARALEPTLPTRVELAAYLQHAKKAQEEVETARAKLAGVYDTVDKATSQALGLTDPGDAGRMTEAKLMQSTAEASRRAVSQAQAAANALVDTALQLQACLLAEAAQPGSPCTTQVPRLYDSAKQQQAIHESSLKTAKAHLESLADMALRIDVDSRWPDKAARLKAYEFGKVLRDYPDATAPFAKDSFQILAGRKSAASIQFGLESVLPNGWRRVTMKASSPLGDGAYTELFGSADGLDNGRRLALAWDAEGFRGRFLGSEKVLWAGGLELGWGYQDLAYYGDGVSAFADGKQSKRVLPWELAGSLAVHETGNARAHLLSFKRQRTYESARARIRCPTGVADGSLDYVDCITGPVGEPTGRRAWVLGYELRYKGSDFALSPSLAYNTRTEVASVGLPLYLVKSADDPKRPLNAGVRLDWSSRGDPSITGRERSAWTWGVFVGAPFSLLSGRD